MQSKWFWYILRLSRQISVRTTMIALLALLAAIAAEVAETQIPDVLSQRLGEDAVMPILNVLATTMLAVTTFSLSVMVSAHHAAAGQVTPRAHRILLEDTVTQSVLATFLGAFIYALFAMLLFRAGVYGARASVIVFATTVLVVILVVIAILRWIEHLSKLGSMDETMRKVETRAREAFVQRQESATFRANLLESSDLVPTDALPIMADCSGFVQFVDIAALNRAARAVTSEIYVLAAPGTFVLEGQPILRARPLHPELAETTRGAVSIGDIRTFENDVLCGVNVLSEIGQRALSPGVNDPGSAIEVIGRLEALIAEFRAPQGTEVRYPNVWIAPVTTRDLIDTAFRSLARDGAGQVEVLVRIRQAMARLAAFDNAELEEAALEMDAYVMAQGADKLKLEDDTARLRAAAQPSLLRRV